MLSIFYIVQNKHLLYLYGGTASGKTTLLRLLDGHPEVAVTPLHDKLPDAFSQSNLNRFPVERTAMMINGTRLLDLHRFQTALTKSRYNRLQEIHHGRPVRFAASSSDIQGQSMDRFDFYAFEEQWVNEVNEIENINLHDIIYHIFDSLFIHWEQYPYNHEECKYYVGLGAPNPNSIKYTLKNWPKAKIICVQRDPRGCIAAKAQKVEDSAYDLLKSGRIYNVKSINDCALEMRRNYPDRVKVIQFEDLILNSDTVIKEVQSFLEIVDDPILAKPTYCGENLESYEQNYIGEINDKWDDLLSNDERRLANLQLQQYKYSDLRLRPVLDYLKAAMILRLQSILSNTGKRVSDSKFYIGGHKF